MGHTQIASLYTIEKYLAMERVSIERHEYIDGRIYEVESATEISALITVNLMAVISQQLKGRDCVSLSPNMKIRSRLSFPENSAKVFFTYADMIVACGKRSFHDEFTDVLLNPKVIIEILSPTTEAYDRGEKFRRYRQWIPSFTDYLLVSQTEALVEHFRFDKSGFWVLAATATDLAEHIKIASIGCELAMTEIYDRVEFSAVIDDEQEKPKRKRATKKAKK